MCVANEQKESRDAEIGFDNFLFWVGKGLTFFFHKSSFQNAVRKKTRARAFFCRATPHMEGGRRRLDGDDRDGDDHGAIALFCCSSLLGAELVVTVVAAASPYKRPRGGNVPASDNVAASQLAGPTAG